jgi:hypothetical protein
MPGGVLGLQRNATILHYNGDGTVTVALNDSAVLKDAQNEYKIDLPIAYSDGLGAFIGGWPEVGTPISIEQAQGCWSFSNYSKPDNVFSKNESLQGTSFDELFGNIMEDFRPGRVLIQSSGRANRIYLDKEDGILIGTAASSMHLDPKKSILSHNYDSEYSFTLANRHITSTIKRDLGSNSLRNIEGSILEDHNYENSLTEIGMDPDQITAPITSGSLIRNLPLVESREIVYELSNLQASLAFSTDAKEIEKYGSSYTTNDNTVLRTDSRTNTFNLNLYNPNHLIEEIKGTGVDTFGNILDLNRAALPIGKNKASFIDNEDLTDAFKKIRAEHRKSLAYHFEINARKQQTDNETFNVPLSSSIEDNMGRFLSTFFVDIDKEGQFKINIPSSSETGNVALPVRYINSTVLAYEDGQISNPNEFVQEDEFIDIYLQDFSVAGRFNPKPAYQSTKGIKLVGEEGDVGPIDTIKKEAILVNTPFHNILDAGFTFTEEWYSRNSAVGGGIVRRPVGSRLNSADQGYGNSIQYDKIVSNEIKVNGEGANAGGRSGTINLDGFLQLGLGANTIDRQSLWLDTAGGIVSTIGRDKKGISCCASLDGDLLIQVGGVGVGASTDGRFSDESDSVRAGAIDIRVLRTDGQITVIRIDKTGVIVTSPGRITLESQQDLTLRARGQLNLEGETISFFEGVSKRSVMRTGKDV